MNKYISKHFGEMDLDAVEECYEGEIEYKEKTITLDLYIMAAKQIEAGYIRAVDDFLDHLSLHEAAIRSALKKDLKVGGFTRSYVDIMLEELDEDEINDLLAGADQKLKKKEQLLSLIYLHRIGFYPEKEDESLAVFDYTLNEDLTDELLVVNISKDKQIKWITVES
jgi:hypothetical protein